MKLGKQVTLPFAMCGRSKDVFQISGVLENAWRNMLNDCLFLKYLPKVSKIKSTYHKFRQKKS